MALRSSALWLFAAATACSPPAATDADNVAGEAVPAPPVAAPDLMPPVEPPAPDTPGRLPGDRVPVAEAPFAETGAQGAADVVQAYYALLEARRHADARRLWSGEGEASGTDEAAFAARFARYADYHARIGAPGTIEGAAGSLYVEVPVLLYGRLKKGEPFRRRATVTLRRVNDVPGATAAQRRWHIQKIEPAPAD
jgi:hypothetical protein